jgi:hypothetical protein
LFSLGTGTPLRGAGKKQAARPLFFKPNNDGNEQHGWQFFQSGPARQKVGPQRNGEISLRHAVSDVRNAKNSPLTAQERLVQDLGSRSPTARRLAKFARTTCDGRQSPNKQRNGKMLGFGKQTQERVSSVEEKWLKDALALALMNCPRSQKKPFLLYVLA